MKYFLIFILFTFSLNAREYPRYEEQEYIEWYSSLTLGDKAIEDQRRADEIAYDIRTDEIKVRNVSLIARIKSLKNFKAAWNKATGNSEYRHGVRKYILRQRDDTKAENRVARLELEDAKYQEYELAKSNSEAKRRAKPNIREWIEAKINNDQDDIDSFMIKWTQWKTDHP